MDTRIPLVGADRLLGLQLVGNDWRSFVRPRRPYGLMEKDDPDDGGGGKDDPADDPDDEDDDDEDDDKSKSKKPEPNWKALSRKHEREAKKLKAELAKRDTDSKSESQKALDTAKAEGERAGIGKVAQRLLDAEIRAAAGGKFKNPKLAVRLVDREDLIDDDGNVDTEAVEDAIADLLKENPDLAAKAGKDDDEDDDTDDGKGGKRKAPPSDGGPRGSRGKGKANDDASRYDDMSVDDMRVELGQKKK